MPPHFVKQPADIGKAEEQRRLVDRREQAGPRARFSADPIADSRQEDLFPILQLLVKQRASIRQTRHKKGPYLLTCLPLHFTF